MKTKIIFILFFFSLSIVNLQAQEWEPLGPDDFNQISPEFTPNQSFVLQSSDGTSYEAYANWETYIGYKISVKKWNGNKWEFVGEEGFGRGSSYNFPLALDHSGNLYIAYNDGENNYKITVKKYNGSAWEIIGTAGFADGTSVINDLAVNSSGVPYVAYINQSYNLIVKKWDGNSWINLGTEEFSTFSNIYGPFSFELDPFDIPYVAYTDEEYKSIVKKWNGSTWETVGAPILIEEVAFFRLKLDISGVPYVSYLSLDGSIIKLSVNKWNGSDWETVASAGLPESEWDITNMFLSLDPNGKPFIAYSYRSFYLYEDRQVVTVKKWNGNSWENVGDEKFLIPPYILYYLEIDSSGDPYVSYMENSIHKPVVKKYYGNTWEIIGDKRISVGTVAPDISLELNPSDIPFIAYIDHGSGYKGTLKKWNGNTWENFGTEISIESGMVDGLGCISLAFDASEAPFVAYIDGVSGKAMVKKWTGSTWETIGTAGFSIGNPYSINIVLDSNGKPYVAYFDEGNNYKVTVKMLNGNTWETVGDIGSSVEWYRNLSLTLDDLGNPYIAFPDFENGSNLVVKKWTGSTWETIGEESSNSGPVYETYLIFNSNDLPYVAYSNDSDGRRVTVKKWNNTIWETVGSEGISLGEAYSISLKFDAVDNPYIAYLDRGYGDKSVAKKWDGNTWETVGNEGFSAGMIYCISLVIDESGNLIVAYGSSDPFVKKFATGVVSLSKYTAASDIFIYPNPTSDFVRVEMDKNYVSITIEIYDILGKKLITVKEDVENINIRNLRNGIYFLKLITDKGEASIKFIVKK